VFDSVLVAARLRPLDHASDDLQKVNGPGVEFCPLPDYHGPWQYLRTRGKVISTVRESIARCDAYILRSPGTIATLVWKNLPKGTPFGVEVVGDPWTSYAPGSVRSITRPFVRRLSTRNLVAQCRQASAALYVTERALQRRYPPKEGAFTIGCSSVQLGAQQILTDTSQRLEALSTISTRLAGGGDPVRLGFIGSFSQPHKLPHVHIQAVSRCVAQGGNLVLEMIGDGQHLDAMRALARELGVGDRVTFRGRLPGGKAILDALDTFDLFLNATAAEGLPRVVIEAMARGCPCLASDVGGTSELLESRYLVPPGDADVLAGAILRVLNDPEGMAAAVERNPRVAQNYTGEVLEEKRRRFYQALRERTERWMAGEP
jgi:glycosyltransferase involved in cell wall biosynthesis